MTASWSTLEVGRGPQAKIVGPLTRTDFVRYQGASGDFNPIHHDDEFAQSAGFPTAFSVGMLQAGILATYATDWLGADNVRRFGVQFREQVWPGDELELTGSVVEKGTADELGERTVEVELHAQRVGGGTAIKGWATFAVPE
jgi:acyl dehydratase